MPQGHASSLPACHSLSLSLALALATGLLFDFWGPFSGIYFVTCYLCRHVATSSKLRAKGRQRKHVGGAGKRVRRTYKPVSACLFARPPASGLRFGGRAMCALSGPHSSPLAGSKRTLASRNWNKGSLSYVAMCASVCECVWVCKRVCLWQTHLIFIKFVRSRLLFSFGTYQNKHLLLLFYANSLIPSECYNSIICFVLK